ncbi:MAG: HAD-IB family hydrolase [Candidatus Acidiferrum sp.]
MHGNKMHLRGVHTEEVLGGRDIPICRFAEVLDGRGTEKTEERKRHARMPASLFAEAIDQVVWHVEHGHLIVIVSGTLECLAEEAARELEARLGTRDLAGTIRVCATRLEAVDGRWTGRVVGEAMFGEAKARAIRGIAAEADLDLSRCFAYGDSASDRWMLEAVGKPAVVNPSNDLARIARRNDWAILRWGREKTLAQRTRRAQRTQREEEVEHDLQVAGTKAGFRA